MEELLPLGSVVWLDDDGSERFAVIGYYPEDGDGTSYDYLMTPYPQGMFEFPNMLMVNDEVIRGVEYRGFENAESREVLSLIQEMMYARAQDNVRAVQSLAHYLTEHSDDLERGDVE